MLPLLRARDAALRRGLRTRARSRASRRCTRSSSISASCRRTAPCACIMAGFTDYFTATSVFAAHQADVTAIVPYLEAQLPDGTWKKVSDDIGFPAGLRRTMTADLTRQAAAGHAAHPHLDEPEGLLGPGAHRHDAGRRRAVGAAPRRRCSRRRSPTAASRARSPGTPAADLTVRARRGQPVRPVRAASRLLHALRRRAPAPQRRRRSLRIFGAGDEVSLEFDAAALPPVRAGWTRDYLFFIDRAT